MGKAKQPYQHLGSHLKALRERKQETIGEVSGSVEIDSAELSRYESGQICPTEDIMVLLINHFDIKDEEANRLWELAGYHKNETSRQMENDNDPGHEQSVIVTPGEARIVYTDMVHVMVNNYGVVMNFMQGAGTNMQPLAVARIGMSKEHARSVLDVLSQTLKQAESPRQQKSLPHPKKRDTTQEK